MTAHLAIRPDFWTRRGVGGKRLSSVERAILAALDEIHRGCKCKCSMIVNCAVFYAAEKPCASRKKYGACDHKIRNLPTCLLKLPHGCDLWRAGRRCRCAREQMSCCMVTGCEQRRKGKACDCQRTPAQSCSHLIAQIQRYVGLTHQRAQLLADIWAEQLWQFLPAEYADRPLAFSGVETRTREEAVHLMMVRASPDLQVSLWHPQDRRGNEGAMLPRSKAVGLKRLLAASSQVKGDAV